MGLKEILAAKKAAAEKENSNEAATAQTAPIAQANPEPTSVPVQADLAPSKDEVLVDANGKPLSGFALVKRRKELVAQAALGVVNETKKEETSVSTAPDSTAIVGTENASGQDITDATKQEVQVSPGSNVEGSEGAIDSTDYTHESYIVAAPETKQAYSDIKQRIDALVSLSDLDLKTAMTELKKSLMQNTNAVALMLPSDIGQMVIALRKMTGIELAKAEEKKTGKKGGKIKEVMLSADELEEAFKEL